MGELSDIGPARPEDEPALVAIANAAFGRADDLTALREHTRTQVIVARLDGVAVGYAVVQTVLEEAELHAIAVEASRRRAGLGRALLAAAREAAERAGASRMFLEVARGNTSAVALYRAAGFVVDGERAGYYADGDDALLMSAALRRPG